MVGDSQDEVEQVILRYQTDQLAERRRLTAEAETAWKQANNALQNVGNLKYGAVP